MRIECIGPPFTYRWPDGEVRLVPGQPVELPDGRAVRLLERAPGRVRVVKPADKIRVDLIGQIVVWESPLFGVLTATVYEDLPHGVRVVHPLTEVECVIPREWLRLSLSQRQELRPPDPLNRVSGTPVSVSERPD